MLKSYQIAKHKTIMEKKKSPEEIFSRQEIQNALKKAARITKRSGLESGFFVAEKPNGTLAPGKVVEGGCEGMQRAGSDSSMDDGLDVSWPLRAIVHLHTEPNLPVPSPEDIYLFFKDNIVDRERYVECIGSVDNQDTIHLLTVSIDKALSGRVGRLRQEQRKQIAETMLNLELQPIWKKDWKLGEEDKLTEIFENCGLTARFRRIKLK